MKRTTIRVPRTIDSSVADRPPLERVIGTSLKISAGVVGVGAFIERLFLLALIIAAGAFVIRLASAIGAAS